MAASEPRHHDATPWYLPLLRAVPALVLAAVVTFSQDHSAPVGSYAFGVFAVIAAVLWAVDAALAGSVERVVAAIAAIVSLIGGVAALVAPQAGLSYLVFVASGVFAVTGFLELYLGLRRRPRDTVGRDRIFVGGLTAVMAIALLVIPPDYSRPLGGIEQVPGELTASVMVVGALGAFWAIFGVYLVIAGLSLKWGTSPAPARTEEVAG